MLISCGCIFLPKTLQNIYKTSMNNKKPNIFNGYRDSLVQPFIIRWTYMLIDVQGYKQPRRLKGYILKESYFL